MSDVEAAVAATTAGLNAAASAWQHTSTIAVAAAGDNIIAAAGADRRIRVHAVTLVASGGANAVRFESGASGTALTGVMSLADNGRLTLPYNPAGWFETAVGAALNLELLNAAAVSGSLTVSDR